MYQRTKTLALFICLLSAGAAAQKTPAEFSVSPDKITITNTSNKEILAYVLSYTSAIQGTLSHDLYFKQGLAPATTDDITDMFPPQAKHFKGAKLLFVQFGDATIWGDPRLAVKMLSIRQAKRDFLAAAANAFEDRGESGFIEFLESKVQNQEIHSPAEAHIQEKAKYLLQVQKQAGTEAALDEVKKQLAAANSKLF